MKIMFLIRSLERGGAERQLVLLARELKKYGHSITVLIFYGGGPLEQELIRSGIKVVVLSKKGRWDIISFLKKLISEIKNNPPEILYSFLTTSNVFSLFVRFFFPSIKLVWGLRASNMDLKYYDWTNRILFFLEKKTAFLARGLIANSYAGKEHALQTGFLKKSIIVIQNGVDVTRFQINAAMRNELRKAWAIAEEEKVIGIVARLDPMKDYLTFLEAASLLLQKRKDVRFVCKGTGSKAYTVLIKKRVHDLNLMDKMLWIEEEVLSEQIYNALDLFCLTSAFGEGFSNVLGEAMACGVPCIATNVGDAALIVGDLGEVVPIRSPAILAGKCNELLNKTPNPLLIRQRIIDNFSVDRMVQKTEATLRGMVVAYD